MPQYRDNTQTICALATPPGVGGIGVIRVSGNQALAKTTSLCGFMPSNPESHKIYYGHIKDAAGSQEIDEVLVSYFAEGRSFTGEETVEVSFHGSPLIGTRILSELVLAGCRIAEPGEFTYRAFINGRIDLVQAESILNLIESQTEMSRAVSLRQLQGALSKNLLEIEQELTQCLAYLEANLDFSSEDIEFAKPEVISSRLEAIDEKLQSLVATHNHGRVLRAGYQVAIVGSPNVGKSSLLNYLAGTERAIVTDIPGTTRDVVSAEVQIQGHLVKFYDTAGIREATDVVEKIGIERSYRAAGEADMLLWVEDAAAESPAAPIKHKNLVKVLNKIDLSPPAERKNDTLYISAKTGSGVQDLISMVGSQLSQMGADTDVVVLAARQFRLLNEAQRFVQKGRELYDSDASPEFVISEVQCALENVMEVLGKRFDDEVLDQVFRQFCLGK